MQDTTHTIFHSAARFFSGTMLSRITGMLRDVIMAFAFGTQGSVAALLVAFRWSHLLRRLLGEGALQTAFIPHFEKLRSEDPQRAGRFFRDLAAALTVALLAIVVITMGGLWGALQYGNFSAGNQEIIFLTFIMMPGLLFICLYGLNASLLQCEKNYFTASAAPIAFNIIWIIGVVCVWKLAGPHTMPWLAVFIVLACVGEWSITLPKTWEILKKFEIGNFWGEIRFFSTDLTGIAKPLFLGMIGVGAAQINNAMDTIFARYASEEGPAYLWYAIRLQQLPLALFGIALSGALLPPLSRAIKSNDLPKYQHFLDFAIKSCLGIMIPITAAIFIMGDSSINLIYGHGDFTNLSTVGTTTCLWGYGLGLVPMALVLIVAPAFYAQGNYKIPTQASLLAMGINMGLNTFLVVGMGMGAASVAVATSVSAWINVAYLLFFLKRKMGTIGTSSLLTSLFIFTAASMTASAAVLGYEHFFLNGSNAWMIISGAIPDFPRKFGVQLVLLVGEALCFFAITGALIPWKDFSKLRSPINTNLSRRDSRE